MRKLSDYKKQLKVRESKRDNCIFAESNRYKKQITIMSKVNSKKYLSNPGPIDLSHIRDTSEKALQRALLLQTIEGQNSVFNEEKIEWLDIELPVIITPCSRRPSIDLIGRDSQGTLVLCEVKFNNGNDSPHKAEMEILGYLAEIFLHHEELDKNNIHHPNMTHSTFNWGELINTKPRVFIIANCGYWENWQRMFDKEWKKNTDKSKALANGMRIKDNSIECYSIDIDKNYFKNQFDIKSKTKEESYKPVLNVFEWTKIAPLN